MERETFPAKFASSPPIRAQLCDSVEVPQRRAIWPGIYRGDVMREDDLRLSDSGRHSTGDPDVNGGSSRPDR